MKKIRFVKMHSVWSDFVILNDSELKQKNIELSKEFIRRICDRNFGIWADGLLLITKWKKTDFKYIIFNLDGSETKICWCALICYMNFLFYNNMLVKKNINVETWIWILTLSIRDNVVTVDMPPPSRIKNLLYKTKKLWDKFPIKVDNTEFIFVPISMWNSHAVIFVKDLTFIDCFCLEKYWPLIWNNKDIFLSKTNVEFAYVYSDIEIKLRIWGRWIWEMLACWSCACATVVAWILWWKLKRNVFIKVVLKWGNLEVKWSWNIKDSVIMKWRAEVVSEWVYLLK